MPRALIVTTAGINCDGELAEAFDCAGAAVESMHLNALMRAPGVIDRFDLIGLPGGFSYGDAVAAGRIAAQLMRRTLYRALVSAVERGVPIIAPCNGFQTAVQLGLLPGPAPGEPWPEDPPPPTLALAPNRSARFEDRWTGVTVPSDTRCIWTRGLEPDPATALLPSAHGEGRLVAADAALVQRLNADGRVAVRYAAEENFNGSVDDIAGICDASGLVFGLMPHPERYLRWTQHPRWARLTPRQMTGDPPGLAMFRNAVAQAAEPAGRTALHAGG